MRFIVAAIFFLFFFLPAQGQNTDSFFQAVDSSSKAMSERIRAHEDSFYKVEIKRSMEQNGRNLDRFLADMREREKREERQMYIRLVLGVAFLGVLVFGLLRKRKQAAKKI